MFCEARASSKEHVWPIWLLQRLGVTEEGEINAQRGSAAPKTWKAGKDGQKVRFVCADCNNTWMSQLETRAKPVIEGLFDNATSTLFRHEQTILATWAAKGAMIHEALRLPTSWYYSENERRMLRESQQVPARTSVWIAKCVEHSDIYCKAVDLNGIAEHSEDPVKAYVTTMGFGPLAIQIVTCRFSSSITVDGNVTANLCSGPWDELALRIWPVQSEQIDWPASHGLAREFGLDTFSDRWSPTKRMSV